MTSVYGEYSYSYFSCPSNCQLPMPSLFSSAPQSRACIAGTRKFDHKEGISPHGYLRQFAKLLRLSIGNRVTDVHELQP